MCYGLGGDLRCHVTIINVYDAAHHNSLLRDKSDLYATSVPDHSSEEGLITEAQTSSTVSPQGPSPFQAMSSSSPGLLDEEMVFLGDTGNVHCDTLIHQPLQWLVEEMENNVINSLVNVNLLIL